MEFSSDQLLGVFVKRLNPMEKACPLFINHIDYKIFSPISNLNNIQVCLRIIHHEPLENGCTQPFVLNNYV